MANGDVTITVAITGGSVSKAAVIPSASRVKAIARLNNTSDDADLTATQAGETCCLPGAGPARDLGDGRGVRPRLQGCPRAVGVGQIKDTQ